MLVEPTLLDVTERALTATSKPCTWTEGYDNDLVRATIADFGIDDLICSPTQPRHRHRAKDGALRMRWPIERTNSWLSNFGQLRRNTDRRTIYRLSQLAIAILITAKLIDWRNRWSQPAAYPLNL